MMDAKIADQMGHLFDYISKLFKAKNCIEEVRNSGADINIVRAIVQSAGQSIEDVGKKISAVGVKVFECSSVNHELQPRLPHEEDSDVEFIPIAGTSKTATVVNRPRSKQITDRREMVNTKINVEKSFDCNLCEFHAQSESDLKRHMLIHTGTKRKNQNRKYFKCPICPKQYEDQPSRFEHIQDKHKTTKLFECFLCKYQAFQLIHLKTHMLTHSGKRPFKCKICGKRFFQKIHFSDHMRMHTKEKPFPCENCGKSFSRSGSRNKHHLICRSIPTSK